MNRMELQPIFDRVLFVERYKKICKDHNDLEKSMSGSNKKLYDEILKKIDNSITYFSKDKSFKSIFSFGEFKLELVLTLHSGHVQAHLNYLKNDEWVMYNRFDGYAEELQPGFREHYTIPKYTSEAELEEILHEIFGIYEDIKREVLKEADPQS